jgi:osmotically-inducible protein OsmY
MSVHELIETELERDPQIASLPIHVSESGGIVTLTGHVPRFGDTIAAERAAFRVAGVSAVANDLNRPDCPCADTEIARAAVLAVAHNMHLSQPIMISVRDGLVTLEGIVTTLLEKNAAEELVRHLAGVTGVSNALRVPRAPVTCCLPASRVET